MGKFKLRKFIKEIHTDSQKETESYNSGLLNEQLIVSSFKKAETENLIGYRIVINKILNDRKIQKLKEQDKLKELDKQNAEDKTL